VSADFIIAISGSKQRDLPDLHCDIANLDPADK
jgi:hypothetical protein